MEQLIKNYKEARKTYAEARNKMNASKRNINSKLMPIIEKMCSVERKCLENFKKENKDVPYQIRPIMYPHFIDHDCIKYKEDFLIVRYGSSHCGGESYSKVKIPLAYLDMSLSQIESEHTNYCNEMLPKLVNEIKEKERRKQEKIDFENYQKLKTKFENK
mgnify:CR=1 FL=1